MLPLALAGVLLSLQGGKELARESWRDDGVVIVSDVTAGPTRLVVTVDRKQHTVTVRQGATTVTKSVAPEAAPVVNGTWASYALVAERVKDGRPPLPIKLFLAERDVTLDATARATKTAHGRHLTVTAAQLEVQIDFDGQGAIVHAEVPAQHVIVVSGAAAMALPVATAAPLPANVVAEELACENAGARLHGISWRPQSAPGTLPLVVVIADAGATDRDGNSHVAQHSDSYRLLATALAAAGVASLRYDKRGVGASTLPARVVTFDDFVSDAAALVNQARATKHYSAVYLVGHGEGALVALAVGARWPRLVDGIVTVAAAGRPLAVVLRAQLATKLSAPELQEYDRALAELHAGRAIAPLQSSTLRLILRPYLEAFLRQELFLDPLPLAHAQTTPLLIVQGADDAAATADDARALAAARADARLVILPAVTPTLQPESVKPVAEAILAWIKKS